MQVEPEGCSVSAGLALTVDEDKSRLSGRLIANSEGVQQDKNAGIGESDSQGDRPGYGKGHNDDDQQASHFRPTFPLISGH